MSAANVPIEIDRGEDWAVELVWTDNYDEPVYVVHPCRMEIRNGNGETVALLDTDPDIPAGDIAPIRLSPQIGLIQLYLPRTQTRALLPGDYNYELFVTCDDDNEYTGTQVTKLLFGTVTVNQSFTVI